MISSQLILTTSLVVSICIVRWLQRANRRYPPGPKPLPVIGNIRDLPKSRAWLGYHEMCKKHGDVMFLDIPFQPLLIVNSAQAATDLLEKRSHMYSDRHQLLLPKLLTWDFSMALMPYGADWRSHRRLFNQYLGPNAITAYIDLVQQEVGACLLRLLESPDDVVGHIRQLYASLILQIVYDRKVESLNDEFIHVVEQALDGMNQAGAPGANWVEFMPFIQHIPGWMPGGRTRRLIEKYRPAVQNMVKSPLKALRKAMADGVARPCVASSILTELQETSGSNTLSPEQERLLRNVTGIAYVAAADTTVSASSSFLLAMALYPEVQKKAQQELDRVVGPNRLPEHQDIKAMIYIQAILLEVMRWMPAGPLAIPHRLSEDDEYNGYFIPAGTVVIPNAWAMLHDPEAYPEPETFRPERFIKDGEIDLDVRSPNSYAFGFGRRVCPGEALANTAVGLFIARTLHVFNITAGLDHHGKTKPLSAEVGDGFIVHPITTPTGLKPRSEVAERLIREQAAFI